jgi:hypothetical protein
MKRIIPFFTFLLMATAVLAEDTRCYELRIYTANEGKLDALNARFRNHTCKLFEKHGFTNVGYWVPVDKSDNRLIYVISSPNRKAHQKSWQAFLNDPDWKKAYKESTKNGSLIAKIDGTLKIDSIFMSATDYSPVIKSAKVKGSRVFELRTYVTAENRLKNLHARFRDHTCKIFENHDITNVAYWTPMDANKGKANTLTYIISHASQTQAKKNWKGFGGDPAWKKARTASVKDGKILTQHPASTYMKAVDYSLIK